MGFPNIGLQGFAPKLAKGEIAPRSGAGDDARYFQISVPVQGGMLEFTLQLVSAGADTLKRGLQLSAWAALASSGALRRM